MASAEYFREYRRAHPEYRRRESIRRRGRDRGDRSGEYKRKWQRTLARREAETPPPDSLIVWAHEAAQCILSQDNRSLYNDCLYEDVVGELLLARIEKAPDPIGRARKWLVGERVWRRRSSLPVSR